ncbi:MAG: metal ABC transporter permease [Planctomycetota bacterium]|nr:MAG: metal ABC transporter permease [Planctomycetota bacterium]
MTLLDQLGFFIPGIIVAMLVALIGGLLSPLVVLKRLAFVGQGVSHAAFGGVGLAAVLGFGSTRGIDSVARTLIVTAFSIGSGLLVSHLAQRTQRRTDTAIGIVMTASMALGFVLYRLAGKHARESGAGPLPSIEGVLFGELLAISPAGAWTTAGVTALIAALLFWFRRPLVLWAFDEQACAPAGLNTARIATTLLVLLAGAVVLAVQVAGVVLATAILVLPGATALRLTRSLVPAFALSTLIAAATIAAGIVLSVWLDWPPGATIALTQCAAWVVAAVATGWKR